MGPDGDNFFWFNFIVGGLVFFFVLFMVGGSGISTVSIIILYWKLDGYWVFDGLVLMIG